MFKIKSFSLNKDVTPILRYVTPIIFVLVSLTSCTLNNVLAVKPMPSPTPTFGVTQESKLVSHLTPKSTYVTPIFCTVNTGIPNGFLHLRSGAGIKYSVLAILHEGDLLDYLSEENDGWKKVQFGDFVGWVNSLYLSCK